MRAVVLLIVTSLALRAQSGTLDQAWTAAAKGFRTKAIDLARVITKQEPGNAEAHLLLGSLLMEEGEGSEAIKELTEGVQLQPESPDAWNALGEAYTRFGNGKQARGKFERALKLNPGFGVAHSNLGAVLLQAGDSGGAADHLDRAVELLGASADAADAHYLRAKICNTLGQPGEALSHLETAVNLRDNFAAAWSDLGEARRAGGDAAGALTALERAVQLNPKDEVAQYRLGAEYLRRDQIPPALEHLQTAYKLSPEDQSTLNALQNTLRLVGRAQEAARIKQELASVLRARDLKSQKNLQALKLNNQGTELERAGKLLEAADRYKEALHLAPDHNGMRVNYATALLRLGRWAEGLDTLHEASLNDPASQDIQTALKDAIAQAPPAMLPGWAKAIH